MKISVVIPTCNRPRPLARAVQALLRQTRIPDEIVVVDQSENEETRLYLRELNDERVVTIRDSGTGAARSRNIGWKSAHGEIIAFADDDAWAELNWISSILNVFKEYGDSLGILGGKIIPFYDERNPNWTIPARLSYCLPAFDQGEEVRPYLGGSLPPSVNFSIKKTLLTQLGGFDESLGVNHGQKVQVFGEDSDLSLRVRQAGKQLIYSPDCIVYHPVPLERQNQRFLNRRLYVEGVTDGYLHLRRLSRSRKKLLIEILHQFAKTCWLKLSRKMSCSEFQGALNQISGKTFALVYFGILRKER